MHWSMSPSPALALIRPRQLLSALFTCFANRIGRSAKAQVQLPTIFDYFSPAKHPKHCFDCLKDIHKTFLLFYINNGEDSINRTIFK